MSRKVALLALLALVLGACHRQDKPAVDAVARFGDHRLAYADFQRYLDANAGEGANDLSSEVLSELFDQFLDEQLLTQLAADRGLTPQGGTARKGLERLLELEAGAVSEDQVAAYYHAHPEEFSRPERVRLQQILTDSKATAEAARKRLADGADFAAV
nr:peptidylprolyl isomerase [Thermoanaerobaculia bacterium]